MWLNVGDSYAGNGAAYGIEKSTLQGAKHGEVAGARRKTKRGAGLKPKDLIGIPWRLALALQADGWYLRQDIIWHKPNPMPESVTDRCTKAHEYTFLFSKSERYYFDSVAMQEDATGLLASTSYFDDNVRGLDGAFPVQTGGDKMGVVSPFLVKLRGTEQGHLQSAAYGADEAMGTISAGGMHHALVSGRMFGFLQSYYGTDTHAALDEGMGALSTRDRHALVLGADLRIEDMYFRMCAVSELKVAMAFARDYILTGNKRENVKMIGNAVTPPAMRDLVGPCIETLM